MHESPKNKKENEFQNDKEEINNQEEEKIINNISYENKSNEKFNEEININIEENANNKEDKAEKRYHRRYRDIKSPPQKQKECYGQKHLNRRMDKLEEKCKTILLQQQNKNK